MSGFPARPDGRVATLTVFPRIVRMPDNRIAPARA